MKAKPYARDESGVFMECDAKNATHVDIKIPGPSPRLRLPVVLGNTTRDGTNCWSWNGDTERPTLKPSIKSEGYNEELGASYLCHTWVTEGKAQFLSDTTHNLANQVQDLEDI